MLVGSLIGIITFMYQDIVGRLSKTEEMTRLAVGQKCMSLFPTTSSRSDVTIQKLALAASTRIYLMYLGERMPRLDYQEQVERVHQYVKMNSGQISCRHLILATPNTIAWINSQIDAMKGTRNFDLSCFFLSKNISYHQIGISIQLFDEGQVLLVDPGKSTGTLFRERDIFFESRTIADMFSLYYKNVWDKAVPIITDGQLQEKGYGLFQKTFGEIHTVKAIV